MKEEDKNEEKEKGFLESGSEQVENPIKAIIVMFIVASIIAAAIIFLFLTPK